MDLYEAMKVIEEIATGDKEQEAWERVQNAMETYRSLYEGAEKRLMKFRDIAGKPDLCYQSKNKDRFNDLQTAWKTYTSAGVSIRFDDWLFADTENVKGAIS